MNFCKTLNIICVLLLSSLMIGCATQSSVGYGTITKVYPVKNKNGSIQHATLKDAGTGAKIGAGVGAGTGVVAGSAFAFYTLGFGALLMPAFVLAGAGAGAGIGAGIGAGVGANVGLYQYSVKLDNKPDNLIIAQYMKNPLSQETRVAVLLEGDRYSVKKLS